MQSCLNLEKLFSTMSGSKNFHLCWLYISLKLPKTSLMLCYCGMDNLCSVFWKIMECLQVKEATFGSFIAKAFVLIYFFHHSQKILDTSWQRHVFYLQLWVRFSLQTATKRNIFIFLMFPRKWASFNSLSLDISILKREFKKILKTKSFKEIKLKYNIDINHWGKK